MYVGFVVAITVATLLACADAASTTTTDGQATVVLLSNHVRDSPEAGAMNTVRNLRDQAKGIIDAEDEERGVTDQLRSFTNWLRNTRLGQKFLNSRLGQRLMGSKYDQYFKSTKLEQLNPKPKIDPKLNQNSQNVKLEQTASFNQRAKQEAERLKKLQYMDEVHARNKLEKETFMALDKERDLFIKMKGDMTDQAKIALAKSMISKNAVSNEALYKSNISPEQFRIAMGVEHVPFGMPVQGQKARELVPIWIYQDFWTKGQVFSKA